MVSYKRVMKPLARKMFNCGISIKLLPCKVSDSALVDSTWVEPMEISLLTSPHDINNFDRLVNEYEYYNCNAELGYYSKYFVSEEDYNKYQMCNIMCN